MTERSMEHCTLCAEDGGHAPACPRWVPPPDATAAAARAARIARVDETARLLFVRCAVLTDKSVTGLQGIVDSELDAKKCYGHALALERARDEAIKEIQ